MKKQVKNSKILFYIYVAIIVATLTLAIDPVKAAIIEFPLDIEYSGGAEPEGSMPWATAKFIDSVLNTVSLTMSAGNLDGTEFISVWLFNFDPVLNPNFLSFSVDGVPGSIPNNINTGVNAFKAGPDRFYDIEFDFPPPKGNFTNKFTAGEKVVYDISYTGPETINVSSFNFKSDPGRWQGSYHSAAHIQSIGTSGESGWVGNTAVAPEPISSTLFIVGGAVLAGRRFIRRKRK
jgi:hypothetical protein